MNQLLVFNTFRISSGLPLEHSERRKNLCNPQEDPQESNRMLKAPPKVGGIPQPLFSFFLRFTFIYFLISLYVYACTHIGDEEQLMGASWPPASVYGLKMKFRSSGLAASAVFG